MQKNYTRLTIHIQTDLLEFLKQRAAAERRTIGFIMRELIREEMEYEEEL